MSIKTYHLIKLEELGVFIQDKKTSEWYTGYPEGVNITRALELAGMFEH